MKKTTGKGVRPPDYTKKIGLILQGGGALGSYQAGAYEALSNAGYLPDWIAGISIGAINGAIIAGNEPGKRVEKLAAFWDGITSPAHSIPIMPFSEEINRKWYAASALLFGQAGFFAPRPLTAWFGTPVSFYDTGALRSTLESLIDFDRINAGITRLSVGVSNVETGDFAYFDTTRTKIGPEHVMASSALPPGFPPIEIDGQFYWDGGLVSNTPLQYMIDDVPRRSRLMFQVDLFNAAGQVPHDLDSVLERDKDIRYSSRTRTATDMYRIIHDVRHNINTMIEKLPPELRATPEAQFLYEFGCVTQMDIVRLNYQSRSPEGQAKDYEFSPLTMKMRWQQGQQDALAMLDPSPWLVPMAEGSGARIFDLQALANSAAPQTTLMPASTHQA